MRKFALALLLLASACGARLPWHSNDTISMDEARDSVFQVQVTLTLDLSPLYAKGGDDCEADDCPPEGENSFTLIMDRPAQIATFAHATTLADKTAQIGWVGTGWTAARYKNRSFAMTAGHVCESGETYEVTYIDWAKFKINTVQLPIIDRKHVLETRDGVKVETTVIADQDLDKEFNGTDLCLLGAIADLGTPIRIADEDPEFAERAEVIGGPRGLWGGNVAVASDVKFSGRGSVFGVKPDGLAFTGEVAPGNSGSAVIFKGKAIGVISLGATRFPSLVHAVPHETMAEFLRKALHRKK